MFVGRGRELSRLQALYDKDKFECVILYGRRRIGKTRLIQEFVKDKESFCFMGLETNERENLEMLSRSILEADHAASLPASAAVEAVFPSFEKALDAVFRLSKDRRVILVLDEYPYLAASYRGFSSLLQKLMDIYQDTSRLFLILCGSSLSFMENQVLGYKSPLYGRRTAQFLILPLDFEDVRSYYKSFNLTDMALIYGITGGIPQYMRMIRDDWTLERNIREALLDPSAYLFEEPVNLIKQECREPALYNAIIRAIATGASRLSEIATKVGIATGPCTHYLEALISLGIIRRETPFSYPEKGGKKTIYRIQDHFFRFWYRFIPEHYARICQGFSEQAYQQIAPQLNEYMGMVFEDICRQWLWRENREGRLPIHFADLGRWWGNDPVRRQEAEVDIVAVSDDGQAIVAECKWTQSRVNADVLETLIKRGELFRYREKYYYLFSKSGFTADCAEKAKKWDHIRLISFAGMFKSAVRKPV